MAIAYLGYRVDSKEVAKAEDRLDRMDGAAGNAEKSSKRLRVAFAAAATAAAASSALFLKSAISEARKFETAMLSLEGVIKATGGAAGRSADQLREQARNIARSTLESTEGVLKAQQTLLTFRKIQGDVFDDTIKAATDMSAALGVDMNSAVLQLGKALEDPITGMTALTRSGTVFTQAQKDMVRQLVETGRQAEAQSFILSELEAQYGGVAQAAAKGLAGAQDSLGQAFQELKLKIADSLGVLTLATDANNAAAGAVNWLAENLDVFVGVAKGAAVVVGAFATRSIGLAITSFASYVISIGVASTATGIFTGAVNLARAATIALGGPLGIVWGLIGAAGAAWIVFGDNTTKADEAMQEAKDASDALNAALGTFYQTAAPDAGQAAIDLANDYKQLANEAFNAAEAELAAAKATNDALMARQSSGLTQGRGEDANRAVNARLAEASAEYDRALAILEEARKRQKSTVTAVTGAVSDDMTETAAAAKDLAVNVDLAMTGLEGGGKAAAVEIEKIEPAIISATNAVSDMGDAVRDDLSRAWSDFVDRGLRDFDSFGRQILKSFGNMIFQMAMTAKQNPISIGMSMLGGGMASAGGGGTGQLLSAGLNALSGGAIAGAGGLAGLGSAALGGAQFVASGFMSGGLAGAGSALATAASGATLGIGGAAAALGAVALPLAAVAATIMFFKKSTKELDNGLKVAIDGIDATAQTFKKIETSRFFGLSKKRRTTFQADPDNPVLGAVASIQDGVLQAARVMGVGSKAFEDFAFNFKLSLKGLTEEQKLQKINSELAKMGDEFASIVPNFSNMNDLLEAANRAVAETAAMGSTRFESQVLAAARRRGEITMDRSGPGFAEGQSLIRLQKLEEIDTKVEENTRQNNRLTQKMVDLLERWEEVGIPRGPVLT